MEFNFYMPVRVIGGKDAVRRNEAIFAEFGKKCLIVTGKHSAVRSGALDDITEALAHNGIAYKIYDGIGPNPLLSACYEAGQTAFAFGAEFLIGIGGGSPLDAAKAAAIYASNPGLKKEDIYTRVYDHAPIPVILVGTTAGTGSEVSAVSVLTIDETGMKKSISGPDCYAKAAFADSKYTHSVSRDSTVSTALDAMAHAVEGWFSPKCSTSVELFARQGIPLLWTGLKFLYDHPDELPDEAMRETLYYGSVHAGMVLNTCGTAFPHPLGYLLTERYRVPHGKACTAFMPAFLERAKRYAQEKYSALFEMIGVQDTAFISVIRTLTDISGITFTPEEAQAVSKRWNKPKNFLSTPGGFTNEEAVQVLTSLK